MDPLYTDNIRALMEEAVANPSMGIEIRVEWEPTNPHDQHALKVQANYKDIGYVPRADRDRLIQMRPFTYGTGLTGHIHSWGTTEDNAFYCTVEV